jgi:long-chain acyl-CoA synthetase
MPQQKFKPGIERPAQIARFAVGDLLRRSANRTPENIAAVDGNLSITYRDLDQQANRLANYLIDKGIKPGERVSTICANSIELIVSLFALHRAGLIWVPINLMLDDEDVQYTLVHAEVSHVIIDPAFVDNPNLGHVAKSLGLSLTMTETGFPVAVDQPATEPNVDIDRDDVAAIIYTSGTTSKPKGAMHTHQSIIMAIMSSALEWKLDRYDGVTLQLPLFHCGAHCLMLAQFLVGGKVGLMRGFDPELMLKTIHDHKLTICVGLPMMYAAMVDHPSREKYSLDSLRFCLHTMAPMDAPLLKKLVAEFCPTFMLTSGQTEMYPITTISQPDRQLARFGNYWGEAAVVNDMAIMDDKGNILGPNQPGELVHRGANVMLGYYKNPEATEAARAHGWHHTGDLGLITDDHEFLFLDRSKDMIKTGGENVSSIQIEEQILACSQVQAAIVIGIPHPRWGEAITGFIVLAEGAEPDEQAILTQIGDHLGKFQIPKKLIFVESVPTTATGKLRKIEMRQKYADLYADETV